jgi:hypothetical protein
MAARKNCRMYIDIAVSGDVKAGETADFGVLEVTT